MSCLNFSIDCSLNDKEFGIVKEVRREISGKAIFYAKFFEYFKQTGEVFLINSVSFNLDPFMICFDSRGKLRIKKIQIFTNAFFMQVKLSASHSSSS